MRMCLSITLFGLFLSQGSATRNPLALVASIDLPGVEGRIDHLAYDPATGRLFVAALGNNTVEVLDLKNSRHLSTLPGFREPQGIAAAPDLKLVAVANGQGDGIQILDAGDFRATRTVRLGGDADNVRFERAGGRWYVGYGDGALATVTAADGAVAGEARLPGHPESFQLEASGPRIFVNVPAADRIAVVDRRSMKVVAAWPVTDARANFPMALDEPRHRLFIGCRRPAKALVYDTTTGTPLTSFAIVGDTDDLFYDAARRRLYVAGGEGFLDVFEEPEPNHFTRVAHLPTASGARTALFVPDLGRLYLAVPHRGSQAAQIRIYQAP